MPLFHTVTHPTLTVVCAMCACGRETRGQNKIANPTLKTQEGGPDLAALSTHQDGGKGVDPPTHHQYMPWISPL